jgi:hypothetical protein
MLGASLGTSPRRVPDAELIIVALEAGGWNVGGSVCFGLCPQALRNQMDSKGRDAVPTDENSVPHLLELKLRVRAGGIQIKKRMSLLTFEFIKQKLIALTAR